MCVIHAGREWGGRIVNLNIQTKGPLPLPSTDRQICSVHSLTRIITLVYLVIILVNMVNGYIYGRKIIVYFYLLVYAHIYHRFPHTQTLYTFWYIYSCYGGGCLFFYYYITYFNHYRYISWVVLYSFQNQLKATHILTYIRRQTLCVCVCDAPQRGSDLMERRSITGLRQRHRKTLHPEVPTHKRTV